MQKTVFTFYVDDTNPYCAPPEAFKIFLDFVAAEGIAGESSAILGYNWADHGHFDQAQPGVEQPYYEQLRRAYDCGIDTHFELMTHHGRYDFAAHREPANAIHEGLWLYEPEVSVAAYETYFGHILAAGEQVGVRFTGMTWPGCGCPACNRRYAELRAAGHTDPNPNVWQALLHLAQAGKFRSQTVPCFFGGALEVAQASLMANSGQAGIFDLPPNADDRLATWLNDPTYIDVDYYISANGQSGRLVDLVRAGVPYCLFFAHWQGLNPVNGAGWAAFTTVIDRVQRHLKDQIVWMRPSDYTNQLLNPV